MKKLHKRLLFIFIGFIVIFAFAIGLFQITKSRSFQFFGEIIQAIPNDNKRIALTFDDGPTENTEKILNKLDELGIKATFFLCGNDIEKRPEDTMKISESNHAIGNHSYSHRRMIMVSYDFCKEEVEKTNSLIRNSGYNDVIFFRPPNCKKLFMLPAYLHNSGITTITWDIEPETELGFDASPDQIAQNVIDKVKGGSIILLHPMYKPDNVLSALDIVVPELTNHGYSFVTIPDLYREYK